MKKKINELELILPAISINESVSRSVISAFVATLDPTVEELGDIRCAVSEAVTNCIVHAYRGYPADQPGQIYISVRLYDIRQVTITVRDEGCGMEDVELARRPSYTTGEPGERCGMGFLVMESFTDYLKVDSRPGEGTVVLMRKNLRP